MLLAERRDPARDISAAALCILGLGHAGFPVPVSAFLQSDGGVFEGQPPRDGDNRYRQFRFGFFPGSEADEQGFENLVGFDSFTRQHLGGFFAVIGGVMVEFPNLVVDAGICAHL